MKAKVTCAILTLAICAAAAAAAPSVTFSPRAGKFGMIRRGETVELKVAAMNSGAAPVTVQLVPTCSCLSAEPQSRVIPAGGSGTFVLRYDSSDDTGITRKDFLVTTTPPGLADLYYSLMGTVRAQSPEGQPGVSQPVGTAGAASRGPLEITYFFTPGCRSCEEFLSVEIPRLERELGLRIAVERRDILDPGAYEELAHAAALRAVGVSAIPVVLAGNELLQGEEEIRAKLPGLLRASAAALSEGGAAGSAAAGAAADPALSRPAFGGRLSAAAVIAAGLIDGVNPCAFTTLIFLLASLALAGRGRREILLIGSLFSFSVFLTYLGIGFGLFAALRAAAAAAVVSVVLRWVLVAVLVIFAGMSIYDYTLVRRGRAREILLQLPSALKKQIHASIRVGVRTAAVAGSSLVLGFLVSIFEFACTGQVYLPTLAYMARTGRGPSAAGLLVLYNLAFIVPLLAVFGASWAGVSSARITGLFQAHMGLVKLALAAVFLGLAALTLVG